jgi:tRNA-Thr(GGU) m(6)t(6)A37 methyltransferase TsaA
MDIEPIALFRSPFKTKFGIPRQSGIVSQLSGTIELVAKYAQPEALRGLEGYDYLWMIWGFSENVDAAKHPTVRPPLLGGNERVGVWATRSPFRPNNLGLSAVRIKAVRAADCCIDVMGADLMDGTPVYDIKPYLPYVDCHQEARGGFTDRRKWQRLQVEIPAALVELLGKDGTQVLTDVLAEDPRPHYHDDSREYAMPFMDYDIVFSVTDGVLRVCRWQRLE